MTRQSGIGRLFHVLRAQQFDRPLLDHLCDLTTLIRKVAKTREGLNFLRSLLSHKRVMLYFTQPSTRTFLSFENACHILGVQTSEIRNPATSSEYKGESSEDAIRTFSSYVDMIVMRTNVEGLADQTARHLDETERPVPIINAGSGRDQHPTQALLDIYTLHRSFEHRGGIDGKTIAMVGDLARGRTVRSLSYLMKNYRDVKLIFIAPPSLAMRDDLKQFLDKRQIDWSEHDNLEDVVPRADAIYMTRLQDEHDVAGESRQLDLTNFTFHYRFLERLGPEAIVMHPMPRRDEIDRRVDGDPRAVYWRQARNGMWTRTSILANIFAVDDAILERL
ncbi:MAG: aspartate carbamoyltransferase [Planctomycetes bacterium]|nr:aspartate carbamoyltransferase [Planctomycetota bacterium]